MDVFLNIKIICGKLAALIAKSNEEVIPALVAFRKLLEVVVPSSITGKISDLPPECKSTWKKCKPNLMKRWRCFTPYLFRRKPPSLKTDGFGPH